MSFWDDLNRRLEEPRFRRAYVRQWRRLQAPPRRTWRERLLRRKAAR